MSRFARALWWSLAAIAGGLFGQVLAADSGRIDFVVEPSTVDLGRAFPLTVVREWDAALAAEEFDDSALAPLVVRRTGASRRESGGTAVETLRFDAYAFLPGDVTVPAPAFVARAASDGREQVIRGDALTVRVRPALDAEAPGPVELPGEPLPLPFPWGWALGAAAVLLLAGALVVRRLRARPVPPPPPPPEPVPEPEAGALLLAGLETLSARSPEGRDELRAWYGDGAALLRAYVAAQHVIGAPEHTSEEIVALLAGALNVRADERRGLASLLSRCDAVKFAAVEPGSAARDRLVADARAVAMAGSGAEIRTGPEAAS